ncbi:M20/M25/M40 family metallo-hydrolase [Paenibacillus herberti]|uniref:Zinc carboxypeptidase n=1 Tax=Paenibacillus herberti TaxID=1619309 RepID=A0A229NTN4_9BACL|nr:M20/M25/M40 family metallo-hydrolase [Paenibacillus herberti]OXM13182.1 hypothetical protein CGZ75_23775 [Paenibacillus herberti]
MYIQKKRKKSKALLSAAVALSVIGSILSPAAYAAESTAAPSAVMSSAALEALAAQTLAGTQLKQGQPGYDAYGYLSHLTGTIGSRPAGSAEEAAARDYIKLELENMGYSPTVQEFVYKTRTTEGRSSNVITVKHGQSPRTIIVGAHYDSAKAPSKGADDNASGVAVMLESAKAISQQSLPYTVKFVAFGSEENGLQGSKAYVAAMTEEEKNNTVAMINLDSLAAGDNMYVYGNEGDAGFVRNQALAIAQRLGLNVQTQQGVNPEYPAGTTGDWSDHAPFKAAGIPYGYLEATNWNLGDKDGYTQTENDGAIWHTGKDSLGYLQANYPGRVDERLSTFSSVLTTLLQEIKEPGKVLLLSNEKASLTEKRTIAVEFTIPPRSTVTDDTYLNWTYGGKPLSDWKQRDSKAKETDKAFIYLDGKPVIANGKVTANIVFDLAYGTKDLSPRALRVDYPKLLGTNELMVTDKKGNRLASAPIKLNVYDTFRSYDEIRPEIDRITAEAKQDRYIETSVLGKSVQGRDINFTILAKDKASVEQYVNETLPAMTNDPAGLQAKILKGQLSGYKVPIWINNIHPDETPGVDSILNFFEEMTKKDTIEYNTTDKNGNTQKVTINISEALDNVIFLMNFTQNPDGRYNNDRANANGFDLNRDNSYQTQPETKIVTQEIAKWSPLSFLDLHGFVGDFLIEPCTPPHDPNIDYDLLIDNMVEQAHAMGRAAIANTYYDKYHIPYVEAKEVANDPNYKPIGYDKGWDDASPAYTAVYAMHQGALGHTIEIPELNEESTTALLYTLLASTDYVIKNKQKLFLNQLEVYERGINNVDSPAVDKYLVNAKNEEIGRPRPDGKSFFPDYYVLPVDASVQKNALEAANMVNYLLRNGVKVEKSNRAVTVDGVTYPTGTYIVPMTQAKRSFANLVLYDGINVSDFDEMYADIVQSFSYMRGFDRYTVYAKGAFSGATAPVSSAEKPTSVVSGSATHYVIRSTNNDAVRAVNELTAAGKAVTLLNKGGQGYELGDYLVSYSNLKPLLGKYTLQTVPFPAGTAVEGKLLPSVKVASSGVPAFALNDLGYTVTKDQASSDVLVNSFNKSLVEAGKPFVGYGRSWANTLKGSGLLPGLDFKTTGSTHEGLFKAEVSQDSIIGAPYEAKDYLYTQSGTYFTNIPDGAAIVAKASSENDFFVAGWWPGYENVRGKTIGFTYKKDLTDITLFSNELTNKAHPQVQYRLLANAIYKAAPAAAAGSMNDGNGEVPVTDNGNQPSFPGPIPTPTPSPSTAPSVTPEPTPTPTPPVNAPEFKDLGPVAAWASAAINELAAKGILKGLTGDTFGPLKKLTRAEFLTMLARAYELPASDKAASFSDVPAGAWYSEAVAQAVAAGIVKGTGNGKFEPNRPVTREEMAIMAANVWKLNSEPTTPDIAAALSGFADRGAIASYAKEAVGLLASEGIILGTGDGKFTPRGDANRAQAAVIVSRLLLAS